MDVFGVASQEINHHRNLDGIYTDVFGVAYGKKSLEEIFNEKWPLARNLSSEFKRNLYGNKIFTELSHVGKLREVREVREKLRDKCSTSYGKRQLSLNFPNDRRE